MKLIAESHYNSPASWPHHFYDFANLDDEWEYYIENTIYEIQILYKNTFPIEDCELFIEIHYKNKENYIFTTFAGLPPHEIPADIREAIDDDYSNITLIEIILFAPAQSYIHQTNFYFPPQEK